MTQHVFLFLIIAWLFLLQSCGFPCHDPSSIYITNNSKEYFLSGKNGSWYIYENVSDSTDSDTLKVANFTNGLEFRWIEKKCSGDNFEYLKYDLISNNLDTFQVSLGTDRYTDEYRLQGNFHQLNIPCFYSLDKGSRKFGINRNDDFEVLSSYTVNGKTYADVIKITINQFKPPKGQSPVYYHCRNIGLIEFTSSDKNGENPKTYYLKEFSKN